ncbi:shikimate kinase [Thalassospiraceae bacterium LMO-SO8]|nr:shikimate kinase [Alphaproteobacteria bacterium LMO-S08]WND76200.1 shikimate kinase [Thalassospiraceae bacterium LMO-SO8]
MSSQLIQKQEKTIVLVGLMGAGKSSVGRILATKLGLPFIDSDDEVETAAGCSIEDIFEIYGEPAFRDVEERVIDRLLNGPPMVLSSGGGAFMNPRTRARIAETATSVWLRADLEILERRTKRRAAGRPLLKGTDPSEKLKQLINERYPVYEQADIIIESVDETPEKTADKIIEKLTDGTA